MTRLAQRIVKSVTRSERVAIEAYEHNLGRIRRQYSGRRLLELWNGEVNRLERAAVGSPGFDVFADSARKRLAKFEAVLAEAAQ